MKLIRSRRVKSVAIRSLLTLWSPCVSQGSGALLSLLPSVCLFVSLLIPLNSQLHSPSSSCRLVPAGLITYSSFPEIFSVLSLPPFLPFHHQCFGLIDSPPFGCLSFYVFFPFTLSESQHFTCICHV